MKSTCKRCGKKGHWSGDQECPKGPARPPPKPQAHIAVPVPSLPRERQHSASSSEEAPTNWMPAVSGDSSIPTPDDVDTSISKSSGNFAFVGVFSPEEFVDDEIEIDNEPGSYDPDVLVRTFETSVPGGSTKFTFGQRKGSTYAHTTANGPGYINWGLTEPDPSPSLMNFLRWAVEHFDDERGTWTLRASPLTGEVHERELKNLQEKYSRPQGRTRVSKISMITKKDNPCAGGCPAHAINRAGSNSHYIKETCMVCGHKNQYPRPKPERKEDPSKCPHKNTDFRGSTRGCSQSLV